MIICMEQTPQYHLKKALLHCVFSIILIPVVFNFLSLRHLQQYLRLESHPVKWKWAAFVISLNVIAIFVAMFLLKGSIEKFQEVLKNFPSPGGEINLDE